MARTHFVPVVQRHVDKIYRSSAQTLHSSVGRQPISPAAYKDRMNRRQTGISLLEVMVVMTIVGILSAIAIPSFLTTIRNNRLTAYTNDIITGLTLARTEALKRNLPAAICRSANSTAASPACTTGSGTGGWEIGWFVYADNDSSGGFNAGDTVIMRREPYTGGVSITGNNNVANTIRFTSQGITTVAGIGTITLDDGRPTVGVRLICIAATGRPRLTATGTTSCTGV